MGLENYEVDQGIRLTDPNDDSIYIDIIFGSALPGGDSGVQDEAPIGSWYYRRNGTSSTVYQKIENAGATSDWRENGAVSLQIGFRKEKVRAVTGENVAPGARNLTTTPFTDDDGSTLTAANFTVGEFVIGNALGAAVLLEVVDVTAPNITLAVPASAPALAELDSFITPNYLPDPDGQENQALIQINNAGEAVKIADVDWNFATGISLSGAYAAAVGDVTAGDSVEVAIAKLDGVNDAQDQAMGLNQGDTDFGNFVGAAALLLATAQNAKALFQRIGDLLAQLRGVEIAGVTTEATVDSVLVDEIKGIKWFVVAYETNNPNNVKYLEIPAIHDGTPSADATDVDFNRSSRLRIGSFNLVIRPEVNGTGAAQEMRLRASSSVAGGVTVIARRIEIVKSVL